MKIKDGEKKITKKIQQNFGIDLTKIYSHNKLIDLNMGGILFCRKQLDIKSKIIYSSDLELDESLKSSEKLAKICSTLNAKTYVSGKGGIEYLDISFFDCNIEYFKPKSKGLLYNPKSSMKDNVVNKIILSLSGFLSSKKIKLLFIANSNNINNSEISISQLKELDNYFYTYLVVDSIHILEAFLKHPKLLYDYLFADTETKKFQKSVFQSIKDFNNNSVIGFQPSDILINATRKLLTEILYKYPDTSKVLVKGIGKIGFRIIQLLNDFGFHIFLETEEFKKNIIKNTINEFGYNRLNIKDFKKNTKLDLIIGCSNGQVVVDSDFIKNTKLNSIIIDIGIGTVSNKLIESDLTIIRISPRIELERLISEFNFC